MQTPGPCGTLPILALSLVVVLTACGPVEVPVPEFDPEQQAACDAFLDDVPDPLVDLERVDVDPPQAPSRAYGDPALIVSCVDSIPESFDKFAYCVEVNGVGWYLPDAQIDDDTADVTFTAVGYSPVVEVFAPGDYRPEIAAAVLSDLTDAVEDNLTETTPCR